ncbi:MAG: hypothetical protein ACREFU_21665 [Acetobacteraceae bacterium]
MAEPSADEAQTLMQAIAGLMPFRGEAALPVLRTALRTLLDEPVRTAPIARPVHANGDARPAGDGVAANRVKPPGRLAKRRPASVPAPAAEWAAVREELRAALDRHHVSRRKLAEGLGTTPRSLGNWLAPSWRSPPGGAIVAAARAWLAEHPPDPAPEAAEAVALFHRGNGAGARAGAPAGA